MSGDEVEDFCSYSIQLFWQGRTAVAEVVFFLQFEPEPQKLDNEGQAHSDFKLYPPFSKVAVCLA